MTLRELTAYAAAKVNIGWRVGDVRPDGYHDVAGTIQTISLCDRLRFVVGDSSSGVRCDVEGEPLWLTVAGDESLETAGNLVVRAARVLAGRVAPAPVSVTVDKEIPVSAGLGGGSADAAATLVALNVLWDGGLSARQILELGAEVGSDVPAVALGGLVAVSGRGEVVRRIGSATSGAFVLGISDEKVSAADAYERFDEAGAPREASFHHNDLAAAACLLVPGLDERVAAMRDAGAGAVFVTGSGPTVVGVTGDDEQADEVAAKVRDVFARVVVARPVDWGTRIRLGEDAP